MADERLRGMSPWRMAPKPKFKPTSGGSAHSHMATQQAVSNYIAGGHSHSGLQMQHDASHILYYFERFQRIHLGKNRHGGTGDLSIDQFLDFALSIFANKTFNNTARVFQEGLIEEMKEAISKVLQKNFLKVVNNNDTI